MEGPVAAGPGARVVDKPGSQIEAVGVGLDEGMAVGMDGGMAVGLDDGMAVVGLDVFSALEPSLLALELRLLPLALEFLLVLV